MALMTQDPALLTTSQAAKRLQVGPSTVRRWAKEGRLSHVVTPSGRILFRPEDIEAAYRVVRAAGAA